MENGVYAGIFTACKGKHKTKDGWRRHTSYNLTMTGHDSVKKFYEKIYPYALFKKKQVEIVLKAIELKENLKRNGKKISDNFPLFDKFRHDLHKLARKGRKNLKKW